MVRGARTAAIALTLALVAAACDGPVVTLTPPELELVQQPEAMPSVVLDAAGGTLTTLRSEYRERVELDAVPEHLVEAVLAAEDARFRDHDGVDGRALLRAAARNVAAGEVVEGGSTITQQLVELRFLPPTDDTLATKAVEAALAIELEELHSKDWILEEYLNSVYLGGGAHGIGAAAWSYFRARVDELDLAEAALLAGLIRTPGTADPRVDPVAAKQRRDTVLQLMVGTGAIDAATAADARRRPIAVREAPKQPAVREPHFVDRVLQSLLELDELGPDEGARWQRLTGGGLTVHTTLDPDAQASARAALASQLDEADEPDGALVTLDTTTGAVIAAVGSVPYEDLQFDLAMQGTRQPGSVFKGMTLAAAVADGYEAADRLDARGGRLVTDDGVVWSVRSSGRSRATLSTAIRWSDNGAFARLGLELGVQRVAATARTLGIESPLGEQPAMLLGGTEACCTVLEMATAYATLAAMGTRHDPVIVSRVTDATGATVWEADTDGELVFDEVVAFDTVALLEQVVTSGTGRNAAVDGHTVVGKTGTTSDNVDAWFVGATPELTTAVWVGHHDGRRTARVDGRTIMGGVTPARIFAAHMASVLGPGPGPGFTVPERRLVEVEVDIETGLRAGPWCDETEVRTFPDTRTPTASCPSPRPVPRPTQRSPGPAPTAPATPTPTPTPSPTPRGEPSPAPEPSGTPTSPAPSPTATPSQEPTPAPSPAPTPAPAPAPTPTPSPAPSPTPSSPPSPTPAPAGSPAP